MTEKIYCVDINECCDGVIDTRVISFFKMPHDFQEVISAHLEIYNNNLGNLRWCLDCYWASIGQRWDTNLMSIHDTTKLISRDSALIVGDVFEKIKANDLVHLYFFRYGTNVYDTISSFIEVLRFKLIYRSSTPTVREKE